MGSHKQFQSDSGVKFTFHSQGWDLPNFKLLSGEVIEAAEGLSNGERGTIRAQKLASLLLVLRKNPERIFPIDRPQFRHAEAALRKRLVVRGRLNVRSVTSEHDL